MKNKDLKVPDFVVFFRKVASGVRRNNGGVTYERHQKKGLNILIGKAGNCIAWVNLFVVICLMFGESVKVMRICQQKSKRTAIGHLIGLVLVGNKWWCQSNDSIKSFSNFKNVLKTEAARLSWKRGARVDTVCVKKFKPICKKGTIICGTGYQGQSK